MGIDEGFDLYPPLGDGDDKSKWQLFLWSVMGRYGNDPNVVVKPHAIEFKVGERPFLCFSPSKFRRFSSKISGGCSNAEPYLKEVYNIAKSFFSSRVIWWSELSETPTPYTWSDVHNTVDDVETQRKFLFLAWNPTPRFVVFDQVCMEVLRAFEQVHKGMNGLRFDHATFPDNQGYVIVQKNAGSLFKQLKRIEDWTGDVNNPVAKKAYWAAREQNNCMTLNCLLLKVLEFSNAKYLAIFSQYYNGSANWNAVDINTIAIKQVAIKPNYIGTLVEPPYISKVPPSPDGETYHVFLTGLTVDGKVFALDCSCAQFGIFGGGERCEPFIANDLVPYLKTIGKHRMLSSEDRSVVLDSLVAAKVDAAFNKIRMSNISPRG